MRRWLCVVTGCFALVFYAQAESVRLESLQWAMVGGNDALAMTKIGATFLDWSEGDSRASSTYSLEPYTTASGYFAGIVSDSRGVPSGFVLSRLVYRSTSVVKGRANLLMQVRLPNTATRIYPLGFAVVSPRSVSSSSSYSLNNYSRPVGRSNVEAVLRYGFSALVSRRATKYYSSSARWSASVNYLPPPGGYGSLSDNTCFVPFESQEAIQLCEQLLSATGSSWSALGLQRPTPASSSRRNTSSNRSAKEEVLVEKNYREGESFSDLFQYWTTFEPSLCDQTEAGWAFEITLALGRESGCLFSLPWGRGRETEVYLCRGDSPGRLRVGVGQEDFYSVTVPGGDTGFNTIRIEWRKRGSSGELTFYLNGRLRQTYRMAAPSGGLCGYQVNLSYNRTPNAGGSRRGYAQIRSWALMRGESAEGTATRESWRTEGRKEEAKPSPGTWEDVSEEVALKEKEKAPVIPTRRFSGSPTLSVERGGLLGLFQVDFGSRLSGCDQPTQADRPCGEETLWAFPMEKNFRVLDQYYVLLTPQSRQVYAIWGMHDYPLASGLISSDDSEPVKEYETLVDIFSRFYNRTPNTLSRNSSRQATFNFPNGTLVVRLERGDGRDARLRVQATESSLEALGQAELKQQKNFAKEAIYQEVDLQLLGGSRSAGQTRSATSGQVARSPAKATPKVVRYRFAFPENGGVHRFEPSEPLAFDRYSIPVHRDKIALPETLTRLTAQGFTFDVNISFRRQPGTLFSLQWGRETLEVSFEPSTVVLRLNNRLLTKSPIPEPEAEALRMTLTYYPTKQSTRLYLYLNEQKVWNGPLAEPSEAGVAGLWIRAAYSSANNGQNGVNAWALYASAVGPKVLTPPEELTHPDASAEE